MANNLDRYEKADHAREVDKHGRTPLRILAEKARRPTPDLSLVAVALVHYHPDGLTTRDNNGDTPFDVAQKTSACSEITSLLSLTPEAARLVGEIELLRMYAPVAYWAGKLYKSIESRSPPLRVCHNFMSEHDADLVLEVLKYRNSNVFRCVALNAQENTDSLVFLTLRMIHRHPHALRIKPAGFKSAQQLAQEDACREIAKIFNLAPKQISSTPFSTLLRRFLPTKHREIFGTYNAVCQFIKHIKYDNAELVEIEAVLKPTHKCDVCSSLGAKPCARCKRTFYCSPECQKSAWKRHKKTCKTPTGVASDADLRTLHKGMLLLNRCFKEYGAGDNPTLGVVLEFLEPADAA